MTALNDKNILLTSAQRWIILAIVSTALFLLVVDITILYTALPTLTHDLKATATQKLWVINSYTLVVAGLLPGFGSLGDRFGHKKVFLSGLIVFSIASMIAAFAPSIQVLIFGRVTLAIGAAMMMPATLSIIRVIFSDPKERSLAFGVWASVASGGAAIGPLMGGVLLKFFFWGSVFLINVPIAIMAFLATLYFLPKDETQAQGSLDLFGSFVVMAGLISTSFALKEASSYSPNIFLALVTGVLGLFLLFYFYVNQRKKENPLIDFNLFKETQFSSGVSAAILSSFVLVGIQFAITQKMQLVYNLTPLQAGLYIVPMSIFSFMAGPATGHFMSKIKFSTFLPISLGILSAGLALIVLVQDTSYYLQIFALAITGIGVGTTVTLASTTIMNAAPSSKAGMAASIEEVSYEIGGAIGVAILGSLISIIYSTSLSFPVLIDSEIPKLVYDSLDQAILFSEQLLGTQTPTTGSETIELQAIQIVSAAKAAFSKAFNVVLGMCAAVTLLVSIWVRRVLNKRNP